ncbi:MAG: carbohydrate binding family 9 domain-containing protein [Fidelibacterota bacterium]|nr:MAG: carbohydrate binding family 9 domain-containing protein [Candidatus Neomarinimicrobiota bacterium]
MYRKTPFLIWGLACISLALAQTEIIPYRTDTPPLLDGQLDDELWHQALSYDDFETFQPDFNLPPSERTVVWVAYDDENLYFAIQALDSEPNKIKSAVTKWDNVFQDDWVGVGIDGFNDQQSAYGFVANAHGSQGDLMLNTQGDGDASEDFIWDAAGALTKDGFCVEMQIPLQSIRFAAGSEVVMGLFFFRQLSRRSEMSAFPPIYPDKGSLLAQASRVVFKDLRYHRTYEILPSFTQTDTRESQDGKLKIYKDESGSDVGLTGKIGVTPTLTLDLTVNPDFSQIESDASQVEVNLRAPNFYPEKRPFFLEGSKGLEVAATGYYLGSSINRVVHTRMIADPSIGIKMTGKLGHSNAVGAILARDESPRYDEDYEDQEELQKAANFGILRYKRLLKGENYVGAILTDREHAGGYNRVVGLDARWRLSGTMRLEGNAFYGLSRDPESGEETQAHNVDLAWAYGDRKYNADFGIHRISRDFRLDTGYIPRDGTTTFSFTGSRTFYLQSKLLQKIDMGMYGWVQQDLYYDLNDGRQNLFLRFWMPRSTNLEFDYAIGREIYQGKSFGRGERSLDLHSQLFKSLFLSIRLEWEESPYYDDEENPFQGDVTEQFGYLIFQPTESFSSEVMGIREVFTSRDEEWEIYDYQILRNKTTYQLSKYVFLRAIVDYTEVKYRDYHLKYPEEGVINDEKGLTGELLLGFTYFPGTVLYLGYGTVRENLVYDIVEEDYLYSPDKYTEMKRGLFFKASYNWRL